MGPTLKKKLCHGKYRLPTVPKIMMKCRFLGEKRKGKKKKKKSVT